MSKDYWLECVSIALDESGLTATDDQIESIAKSVESGHDNYGMAHGHECIPNPVQLENDRLSEALQKEREKVVCKECGGRGRIIENYGTRSSNSPCDRCNGAGRHSP